MAKTSPSTVRQVGQAYVLEPVYARPKRVDPLRSAVDAALGVPAKHPVLLGHERVKLRWMEPDENGGLRPKRASK